VVARGGEEDTLITVSQEEREDASGQSAVLDYAGEAIWMAAPG
jgi:hypothetical protein